MLCKPRQFIWNVHTQSIWTFKSLWGMRCYWPELENIHIYSKHLNFEESVRHAYICCYWPELENIHLNTYMYRRVATLPVAYHVTNKSLSGHVHVGVNELPVGFLGTMADLHFRITWYSWGSGPAESPLKMYGECWQRSIKSAAIRDREDR